MGFLKAVGITTGLFVLVGALLGILSLPCLAVHYWTDWHWAWGTPGSAFLILLHTAIVSDGGSAQTEHRPNKTEQGISLNASK